MTNLIVATISAALVIVGLVATRVMGRRIERPGDGHVDWALGVAALAPAWLTVILGLMGSTPRPRIGVVMAIAFVASVACALGGAIATEAAVRRRAPTGLDRSRAWWLGVLALAPAWAVGLVGVLLR